MIAVPDQQSQKWLPVSTFQLENAGCGGMHWHAPLGKKQDPISNIDWNDKW
jgi:hypothetical protein